MTEPLVIVTGFGRCGSSAMMAMLAAGGVPPYTTPEMMGRSFEHPDALTLPRRTRWLDHVPEGSAVKVIDPIKHALPDDRAYRFIVMIRNAGHQARSWKSFSRANKKPPVNATKLRKWLEGQYSALIPKIESYRNSPYLTVRFEDLIQNPRGEARMVWHLLHRDLDLDAMAAAVWKRPPEHQGRVMEIERWQGEVA